MLDTVLIKFIITGLSNTIISYVVFILCLMLFSDLALKGTVSQLFGYTAGVFWSYFINRIWTFKSKEPVFRQMRRFVSLQVTFALISSALIGFFVDYIQFNPTITWLLVMTVITFLNYITSRRWAFASK